LFRRNRTDPTSPVSGLRTVLPDYVDAAAVAMVFALESESHARVVYLTGSRSVNPMYGRVWHLEVRESEDAGSGYRALSMQFDPSSDKTGQILGRVILMLLGALVVV
jgi:hypothetical protein